MQRPRKAVIPAAGLGTRLHALAKGQAKEMLPIAGRPMISYALREAVHSRIERVFIVISHRKPALRRYLESERLEDDLGACEDEGTRAALPVITLIDQPAPMGSGDAIYRTREMIGEEPFALMMPDFLLHGPSPALCQMIAPYSRLGRDTVGVLTLGPTEARGFGNVGIFQPGPKERGLVEVRRLSGKSKSPLILEQGKTIHKAIGRAILGPHYFSYLEKVRPLKGEWDDAPALRAMCKERKVIGKILDGRGFDAGNPVGYRAAKRAFETS